MLDDDGLILADIRDAARVDEVFATVRPEVVFHAAALKHLPLLEMHPDEGWKTNVGGTLNLLNAARAHGTARFVNVSTDKAANPTSVLGWTKRITERLTAHASAAGPDRVCVGAFRQRARIERFGVAVVRGAGGARVCRSPSPIPTSPATS